MLMPNLGDEEKLRQQLYKFNQALDKMEILAQQKGFQRSKIKGWVNLT